MGRRWARAQCLELHMMRMCSSSGIRLLLRRRTNSAAMTSVFPRWQDHELVSVAEENGTPGTSGPCRWGESDARRRDDFAARLGRVLLVQEHIDGIHGQCIAWPAMKATIQSGGGPSRCSGPGPLATIVQLRNSSLGLRQVQRGIRADRPAREEIDLRVPSTTDGQLSGALGACCRCTVA